MTRFLPPPARNFLSGALYEIKRRLAAALYPLTLSLPVTVSVETTTACNARCVMCPNPVMPRRNRRMEDKVFEAVVSQLGGLNVKLVILSLIGEPLLDDKLVERVRLLSGLGYRVRIVTNASLLTREASRGLIAAGLSELYASLNGYDEKSHHEMMGFGAGQFDNCAGNLSYFSDISRGRVGMRLSCLTSQPMPAGAEKKFSRHWKDMGFKVDIMAPVAWHKAAPERTGRLYPCRVIFSGLVVDCEGNVLPCCRDYRSELVMGRVLKDPLFGIWRGRAFTDFRLKHLSGAADGIPRCAACEINRSFGLVAFLKSVITRE